MSRIAVLLLVPAALLAAVGAGITPTAEKPVTQHIVAGDGFGWGTPADGSPA
ncbi:hypothetical protein OG936_29930 [Streptomyces sp. NBC_00846]|uniref:hypothetical protein n=1 Tax=Streptomyces sp. NBC_00846 TaxID=2975849 RepID=UPI00386DC8CD|nr:hypothetical protein OG936_29930 [Streptomyces sp. NBC_00846]